MMRFRSILPAAGFALGLTLAAAVPAAGEDVMPVRPTAPIAIDENIFNGKAKGFVPPSEVMLSTRLLDMAWTGFFAASDASTVVGYVNDLAAMPTLKLGDVIDMASGNTAVDYQAMAAKWPTASVVVVAVVSFDADRRHGTVSGFASLRIDKIDAKGNPKYIDSTLVGLVPTTLVP